MPFELHIYYGSCNWQELYQVQALSLGSVGLLTIGGRARFIPMTKVGVGACLMLRVV